jgi:hypothetical protein
MVQTSMMNRVVWLDEAFHTVRLEAGSIELGRMKGNIDTPTVEMMPTADRGGAGQSQGMPLAHQPEQGEQRTGEAEDRSDQQPGIAGVVVQPGTGRRLGGHSQGVGRTSHVGHAGQLIAHPAPGDIGPAGREQDQAEKGGDHSEAAGAIMNRAPLDLDPEPGGTVQDQHGHRQQATDQAEGGEQAQQRAFVSGPQVGVEAEGCAQKHVADRHTEHQCRHETADEQRPVPG